MTLRPVRCSRRKAAVDLTRHLPSARLPPPSGGGRGVRKLAATCPADEHSVNDIRRRSAPIGSMGPPLLAARSERAPDDRPPRDPEHAAERAAVARPPGRARDQRHRVAGRGLRSRRRRLTSPQVPGLGVGRGRSRGHLGRLVDGGMGAQRGRREVALAIRRPARVVDGGTSGLDRSRRRRIAVLHPGVRAGRRVRWMGRPGHGPRAAEPARRPTDGRLGAQPPGPGLAVAERARPRRT